MERTDRKCSMLRDCFRGRGPLYRYSAMMLISLLGLGSYTCMDSPGALQKILMKVLEIREDKFSYIYSVISWPGSVLCLVGGLLIDRVFGLKWATIHFSVCVCLGHYIFSLGISLGLFWLVLLGRFIFGAGIEIVSICLNCYTFKWFMGKELSLAICMMVTINRLGTAIMFEMAPPTYSGFVDQYQSKVAAGIVNFLAGISSIISMGIAIALFFLKPERDDLARGEEESKRSAEGKLQIIDIIRFPLSYWILIFEYITVSTVIMIFIPFSQQFFVILHNESMESANRITSTFSILGAAIAPVIGITVDKVGRTTYFLVAGMFLSSFGHILLTFTNATPYVGIVIQALAFTCICATVSPMMPFIIPESKIATAFGLAMSFANLGVTVNMTIAGQLLTTYTYTTLGIFLISWSIAGTVMAVIFCLIDKSGTGYLSMSPAQRKEFDANKKKLDEAQDPLKADTEINTSNFATV